MSIDTTQIATQILLMAIGGITSGVIWVGTRFFKMKRDLDIAFQKIRSLEVLNDARTTVKSCPNDCRKVIK